MSAACVCTVTWVGVWCCRCLTKNSSAIVEIEFERSVCVELYAEYRDLGRFMLRNKGHTIAAGLIEEVSGGTLAQWLLPQNSNLKTLGSIPWQGRVGGCCSVPPSPVLCRLVSA